MGAGRYKSLSFSAKFKKVAINLYPPPKCIPNLTKFSEGVLDLLRGMLIQDGCSSGHIGYQIESKIERLVYLPTPNTPT